MREVPEAPKMIQTIKIQHTDPEVDSRIIEINKSDFNAWKWKGWDKWQDPNEPKPKVGRPKKEDKKDTE